MRLRTDVSFKFAKLAKSLAPDLAIFDEERQKLIEECGGELNEAGTRWAFAVEKAPAFNAGMKALGEVTCEIGPHWPMKLSSLGAVELSPSELMQLEPLFDIETPKPTLNPKPATKKRN
jgi:hypothetical protein